MSKTPKPQTILFRGAEFRHIDMRVSEGSAFVRAHVKCDVTPDLAERFHWEIYRDGHLISGLEGATKLTGELNLEELAFAPNGAPAQPTTPPGDESSLKDQTSRRRLNPKFVEWLMGLPVGWTDYGPLATPSWRNALPRHSEPCVKDRSNYDANL